MFIPRAMSASVPFFVDLDEAANLGGIFKSGLRPAVVRGLENKLCEIRPETTIVFKGGGITTPPLTANWEFRLSGKGRLVSVRGYTQKAWSANEAYEEMAPMEEILGGDPAKMKVFLRGYPATSIDGDMWGNRHRVKGGIRIGYYFRHSMQETLPFLVTYYIDWDLPDRELASGKTALKPPPGYENADMRPFEVQEYEKWQKAQAVFRNNQGSTGPAPEFPSSESAFEFRFLGLWCVWLPLLIVFAFLARRLEQAWRERRCKGR